MQVLATYTRSIMRESTSKLNPSPTTSNFGQITSQANAPRSVQFAARLMW